MRCGRVERLLTPYLDDRLDASSRRSVEEHLAACPGCRATLEAWRSASRALRAAGAAEPPAWLAERAARAAFSRTARPERSWLDRLLGSAWPMAAASAAAAAALLLVVNVRGVGAGHDLGDEAAAVVSDHDVGLDHPAMVAAILAPEGE
jgi:anti-sigma factor RsiW